MMETEQTQAAQQDKKTVIIIGAGPAGLTAAWQLLQKTDMRPVILEATPDIGGIARTVNFHGNRMDIGGHRFFSKSEEVNDLWRQILPPEEFLLRPRVSHILWRGKFFDYPLALSLQTLGKLGLSTAMRAGVGYLASAAHPRPVHSLEDFYINRFGRPLYEMFFKGYTEKLWGVPPSRIAPDWGAQRVKGLSLGKALLQPLFKPQRAREVSLIEQFHYPKHGPGQLWEAMAAQIVRQGGEIRHNCKVTKILLEGNRIAGVVAGDEVFRGACVVSSMPVKDLVTAMGQAVPAQVQDIASQLPYRDFITVGLLTKKLLPGNLKDTWIYMQEKNIKLGRLQLFHNWSPFLAEEPDKAWLGLEYFCTEGDALWSMSADAFISFAVEELARIGVIDPADVLDATHIRVPKAYPGYFGVYQDFSAVRQWLDGVSNLYCVGRNGQHRYNNMDHSMCTAIEAVRAICADDGDKTAIWGVNTEGEQA
ncbi:MAG: NAD(P)/FAD-dependent oxidoreductase [Oscillospiraceae bacterium]|jgi:protoporphyrinogen oxidase|nr:NAD(P)/FAD-dependent oxidoreductase [Oscillospiraceae bacterium]